MDLNFESDNDNILKEIYDDLDYNTNSRDDIAEELDL
jgi:hypothetical protein